MNKILKGLSAFAIASAIGLNTLTVNAATTCEPGETEYTNYYMFLNEDTVDYLTKGVNEAPAGTIFALYNGADKYNDVPNGKKLDDGYVRIKSGNKSTTNSNTSIEWTVAEFWQKYHKGFNNMRSDGYVYEDTVNHESYVFHNEWWKFADETFTNGTPREHVTDATTKALLNYLDSNISSIASSPLATRGTNVPETFITMPNNIGSTTSSPLRWNVARKITSSDLLEGVQIGTGSKKIWSPAAYFVKYCKADGGTTPEKERKITYDPNTTSQVAGMPDPNPFVFKDACTNISTNTPTRTDGYTFLGWSKTKTDTKGDPKYAPNAQYCETEENITLYAIWKEVEKNEDGSYTVTYDANGGKNAPSAQTTPDGSCMNISSGKPTLANNNFLGWSRDPKAKEPDPRYAAGAEYCGADGNITLYAVWQVQSGISAHFIAFSLVAIAAAGALVVAQRKDLFKQI